MIYYPLYPSKFYLLLFSKICKPPDLFLGLKHLAESKVQLLRHSIKDACAAFPLLVFLAVQPVPCICTLAVYTFLSLLYYSVRQSLLPKKATGRSCHIYLMPCTLSYLLCMTFISFDLFVILWYVFLITAITDLQQFYLASQSSMLDCHLWCSPFR